MYSPGYGVQMQVRRFAHGAAFVESYAREQAGAGSSFQILDRKDRADYARAANRNAGISQVTAGDIAFSFLRNGQKFSGYCFAATTLTAMSGSGIWNVQDLYCFMAPEQQVSIAQSVLSHMASTAQVNPQWAAMQQGVTAHSSQTVAQTSAYVSNVISQSYWNNAASQDRLSRARSDATLGVVRLEDPTTGEQFTVRNGSNYYSRVAGTNTVLGSNAGDFPPQLDTRPLIQLQ